MDLGPCIASDAPGKSEAPQTGTTIVAVTFDGGVVLGADGRVSTGTYISNRASNKIQQLTDNVYLLRSGSAADTQAIGDYGETGNTCKKGGRGGGWTGDCRWGTGGDALSFFAAVSLLTQLYTPLYTPLSHTPPVRYFADQLAGELGQAASVQTVAKLVSTMNYQNKEMLMGAMIVAGYDEQRGGQVYGCPIGGSLVREQWAVDGSGSTYIWAALDDGFK